MTSALVIGTFAPDFEYFLRLAPDRGFGHTIVGVFVFTLPVALIVLWLFHAFVKRPMVQLMPRGVQARLTAYAGAFRFGGAARFAVIVGSVLLGISTHVLWDSFTHPDTWAYKRWPLLAQRVHLPVLGSAAYYKAFQHASTVVGSAIVVVWLICWYRRSGPSGEDIGESITSARRFAIVGTVAALAFTGALVRAVVGTEFLTTRVAYSKFVGEAVTAFVAFLWWALVLYGLSARAQSQR